LKSYYEAWFNYKPVLILAELIKYKWRADLYDIELFKQFKGDLVDFWKSTKGISKELARSSVTAKEYNNQIRRLHIAIPILSNDESSEQKKIIFNNSDYQISDDGNIEKKTIARSYNQTNQSLEKNENLVENKEQRWESLISEWIELGEHENQFENKDDEIL
ncbi:6292_t:CDS:2, partial [Dentiscutata erythropus]